MDATDAGWAPIDELLFVRSVLPAIQLLRERTGMSFRAALEAIDSRIRLLMQTRAAGFKVSVENYGQGIFT